MFPLYDFMIYCVITAYTPGANNLLSMSNAIRFGFRRSIRFNFGIFAGFVIVMTLCSLFSATLYTYLPKVKLVMQILGAAYMLYLARKVLKCSVYDTEDTRNDAVFFSGMVLQFANPKIYLYAITALSLYVLPVYQSTWALVGFTILLAVIGASGSFVWALCGSAFSKVLAKHTKIINMVMALLLVYCAISLFI